MKQIEISTATHEKMSPIYSIREEATGEDNYLVTRTYIDDAYKKEFYIKQPIYSAVKETVVHFLHPFPCKSPRFERRRGVVSRNLYMRVVDITRYAKY